MTDSDALSSAPKPSTGSELSLQAAEEGECSSMSAPDEKLRTAPDAQAEPPHPRQDLASWKWTGTMATIFLTSFISGYDVSNVANIQAQLYEAFGNIALLPWIGLSYALANFSMASLARKIIYCFDLRWTLIVNLAVVMIGAIIAGSAHSMEAVIIGRIVMGISATIVLQINLSYMAVFATAAEMPGLVAKMSAIWAVGLTVGGPIGSAMAERHTVTWRWAFYLNLPLVGLAVIVAVLCLPPHSFAAQSSLWKRLSKMDPVGILLNMTSPALLALALTFSGPVWAWYSAEGIALWSLAGLSFVAWAVQQSLCILTTREERAFPVHILRRLDLIPIWIASGCAGTSYGITMYYTPLFFAFAKGHDPLEQTVRTLPFICTFIFTLLFTGYVLPMLGRYKIIYLLAGIVTLSAGVAMASLLDKDTPESPVMGLEALLGFGLGLHFQHGVGVSNVINRNPVDRVDSTIVTGMCQMGFISVSLAVAGCIFQNVGYSQLAKALSSENYSEDTLREALAGFSSVNWHSGNMDLVEKGAQAVIHVISIEFYIVMAAGALCLACALEMSWAKLDYGQ